MTIWKEFTLADQPENLYFRVGLQMEGPH